MSVGLLTWVGGHRVGHSPTTSLSERHVSEGFSAWVRVWLLEDGRVAVKMRFWLPDVALERWPNRPYAEWKRLGLLTVTEGDVTDYSAVQATIIEDCARDGVEAVAYDTRSAMETAQVLQAAGIQVVPIQQGFSQREAIRKMLELVTDGQLCHGSNPILTWMASNLVLLTNSRNERRIAKERAPEKIDGMSAICNVIEWAIVRRELIGASVYESGGLAAV
jgi:phage terminase large subunit-like protein